MEADFVLEIRKFSLKIISLRKEEKRLEFQYELIFNRRLNESLSPYQIGFLSLFFRKYARILEELRVSIEVILPEFQYNDDFKPFVSLIDIVLPEENSSEWCLVFKINLVSSYLSPNVVFRFRGWDIVDRRILHDDPTCEVSDTTFLEYIDSANEETQTPLEKMQRTNPLVKNLIEKLSLIPAGANPFPFKVAKDQIILN